MSADQEPGPTLGKVTLVIGSGSVKCAASLGIQRALLRAGIGLERVVGCSGGAIYAALMAAGHTPETSAQMTARMWTREITQGRNRRAMLQAFAPRWMRFKAERFGLRDDRLLLTRLKEAFGNARIEALQVLELDAVLDLDRVRQRAGAERNDADAGAQIGAWRRRG